MPPEIPTYIKLIDVDTDVETTLFISVSDEVLTVAGGMSGAFFEASDINLKVGDEFKIHVPLFCDIREFGITTAKVVDIKKNQKRNKLTFDEIIYKVCTQE